MASGLQHEPEEVREQIGKGELAVCYVGDRPMLFLPKTSAKRIGKLRIIRMASEFYGPSLMPEARPEVLSWRSSISVRLPHPGPGGLDDSRLATLRERIRVASERTADVGEKEPPEVQETVLKGEMYVQFLPGYVKLFIPIKFIKEIGKSDVNELAGKVYGVENLKEFEVKLGYPWAPWASSYSLILPPAPGNQPPLADPRAEKLKQLIRAACPNVV